MTTPTKTINSAIEPMHFQVGDSLISACKSLGLSLKDTSLTLLAALDLVAAEATKPGEAFENFIVILAQVVPAHQRGDMAKLVLDALADIMERTGG